MATCANCEMSAAYTVADPGADPVHFCATHVPAHLSQRLSSGEFRVGEDLTADAPKGTGKREAAKAEKAQAKALAKVEGEGADAQVDSAPATQKRDTDDNKVAILSASDSPEKVASGSSVPEKKDDKK